MKNKILTFEDIDKLSLLAAKYFENGGVLGLIGDLGVGKTTFTKKICNYYGVKENVKSPTFTYVIEYTSGTKNIYHFDAYRILNSEEIYEIGFEDYISDRDALIIVEWANNIMDEMPEETIFFEIHHYAEDKRKISIYKFEKGVKNYVDLWNYHNN